MNKKLFQPTLNFFGELRAERPKNIQSIYFTKVFSTKHDDLKQEIGAKLA